MSPPVGVRKKDLKMRPQVERASFVTRVQKTIVTNALKNDSAVVAAEDVMRERINIESTNTFKIREW